MKKFLKLMAIPLMFTFLSSNVSCNASTAEVALITDVGEIDDGSFNQTSWEAIKEFCEDSEHPLTYEYYRPIGDSDLYRGLAIQQAVAKGAKIIILPGFKFSGTVAEAQMKYPEVKFLLLDTAVDNMIRENTVCTGYNPEISGYLGGYATAVDYITYDHDHEGGIRSEYKYGYCGGANYATVYPFGYGFIQGIVQGTKEKIEEYNTNGENIELPKLTFNFNYAGVFAQDNAAAARMKDWYSDGVKCVFACGGKLYQSVTEGVKDYNEKHGYVHLEEGNMPRDCARWFGVDCDQYSVIPDDNDKKTIISSALKGLNPSIKIALGLYYIGAWDVINGAYKTTDGDGGFETREAAEKHFDDVVNTYATRNSFKNCETKIEEKDGKFYIKFKSKYDNDFIVYHDQEKQWPLSLESAFGRTALAHSKYGISADKITKDFVGLPVDGVGETEKLKGFYTFNKEQYDKVKIRIAAPLGTENIINVYPGTGIPFYNEDGSEQEIDFSVPTFMNDSDKHYLHFEKESITFNKYYFSEYPAYKIVVNYI